MYSTYIGQSTSARITCEDCSKFLGMDEGCYDKCGECRDLELKAKKIIKTKEKE